MASVPALAIGRRLVGRDADLRQLRERVKEHQVVTLTGTGGIGKSALACALMNDAISDFPDGTFCCDLGELDDPAAVRSSVAAQLKQLVPADASLGEALAGRTLLVVLDNCEHVLAAATAVARELLEAGPQLRIVATSRESLGLPGEQLQPVAPLTVPDGDLATVAAGPAVQLFIERARGVRPDFQLTEENREAVRDLCLRLDGSPLALELAAARTRSMTPEEILDRLLAGLPLAAHAKVGSPQRHRSLHAVVEWSYLLLDEPSRLVFERLGVFAGGCLGWAAEAVCAGGEVAADDVLDLVDGLVDRSLVNVVEYHGRSRYTMLETLRTYALQRLALRPDVGDVHDRHAEHMAKVSDEVLAAMTTAVPAHWERWLADDVHNIRSAVRWCVANDTDPDRAFRIVAGLWSFCFGGLAGTAVELAESVLEKWPATSHRLGPDVAGVAAAGELALDHGVEARAAAELAVSAGADPHAVPPIRGLRVLGELAVWHDSRPEEGLALLEQARNAAREAGRATAVRDVEHLMVFSVAQTGALDDAAKLAARLRAEAEPGTFEALYARLAECLLLARHDVPLAAQSLEQTLSEEVRAVHGLGQMLADLAVGTIRTAQGRYDEAAAAFERALDSSIRSGARRFWVSQVCSALPLLVARNQPEARVLWAAVLASGRPPILLETVGLDAAVAQLGQVEPRAVPAPAALELARRAMRSDGAAAEPPTLRPPSAGATSTAPTTRNASQPHLRQVGAMWSVLFDGNTVHLPDMKGLHDLATLLRQPGREVHVLDLAAAVPAGVVPAQRRDDAGVDGQPGDLGDIVDEQARSAYKRRLTELEEELAEADRLGDAVRAASYAAERDALIAQLSQAYGLSGRVRRAGDPVERARSAVGWRVRTALKKIREADPKLGRHLQHSVHTGVWCSYRPDEPVDWEVTTA